ncbi:MAG: ATP-binding protein [Firmicutes bacterium]|nr:ATP-binding protein [Bacillota bacterium]
MKRGELSRKGLSVVRAEEPQKERHDSGSSLIELGTWETSDFVQSIGMCFRCREERTMGLLIGPPGSGKTTVINSFAQRFNDTVLITATVTMAVKDLLEVIAGAIGVTVYGGNNQRFKQIAEALKRHPVTLIVDETENLITRSSISKIEILRQLHDMAGIGVIFCGTPRLEELIIRGPNGRDNLAQLYSRILYRYRLKGISGKEVTNILTQYTADKAAVDELTAIATNTARGGLRMFTNVLRRCLTISQNTGEPIIKDMVLQATGMMII